MRLFAAGVDDERTAIAVGASTISYGDLKRYVAAATAYLADAGVTAANSVAIAAGEARDGQSLENWIAHLAVMQIGATHASVTSGPGVIRFVRSRAVDIIVGQPAIGEALPEGLRHVPFSLADVLDREPLPFRDSDSPPRRLNTSSGTTGLPKLVEWDHPTLESRVDQVGQHIVVDSRVLVLLKISTTAGFRYPLAAWRAGACVIFRDRDSDAADFDAIERSSLLVCSPNQLAQRLQRKPGEWASRDGRTIAVLGARIPQQARDAALARAAGSVLVSYGSTESGNIAFGDSILTDRHPGAVGFVRDDVVLQVIDGTGKQVPPGQRGLIRIRGGAVCGSAYTEGADGQPWFYPGDLGILFEDGLLAIEGRASETINIAGTKHSTLDLEARLADLPQVRELCLCVVPLPGKDQPTVALVCEPGADLTQLRTMMDHRLPFREFGVVVLPKLPRNAMGKVPRASLAKAIAATMQEQRSRVGHA